MNELKITNPDLYGVISVHTKYEILFISVLIIDIYEITTKLGWYKKAIRFFLIGIILGMEFSGLIPIRDFDLGVYHTASFSAVVASFLLLIRVGKYGLRKATNT